MCDRLNCTAKLAKKELQQNAVALLCVRSLIYILT